MTGKSMEFLLAVRLPIFCSTICSTEFPDNGTPEFEERLKILRESVKESKQ